MTIRCHFDGKTFVPDDPVDSLTIGQRAEVHFNLQRVEFTGGPGATIGELLRAVDATGDIFDNEVESLELARRIRREGIAPNAHKQQSLAELQKFLEGSSNGNTTERSDE